MLCLQGFLLICLTHKPTLCYATLVYGYTIALYVRKKLTKNLVDLPKSNIDLVSQTLSEIRRCET